MRPKIIKFNYPKWWDDVGGSFKEMLPNGSGIWGDCQFFVNDDSIRECDYWFICEDHNFYLFDVVKCPKVNCILITNEAESMWSYDERYLKQFGRIMTSRVDIIGKNVIRQQHICSWHVKKEYQYLKSTEIPQKTNNLSAIISNAFSLEGHKKRYKLMNRLKGHFKDQLDWFGKGEAPINDKWNGLAPYKYSIAIENSAHERYFTEKIMDCYLSYTMPIYWGCSNITDYFPKESLIILEDLDDYKTCIKKIDEAIEGNLFENNLEAIIEARNLVIDKFQVFAFLKDWISTDTEQNDNCIKNNLIHEKSFFDKSLNIKQMLHYHYSKIIATNESFH
jgi:hypothetical protein